MNVIARNTAPPIDELSNVLAHWREEVKQTYGESIEAIFATGRKLIDARKALVGQKGAWTKLTHDELPFGKRHAERFIAIAACNMMSKATDTSRLPHSIETLAALAALPPNILKRAFKDGTINPKMTEKDARALKPPVEEEPEEEGEESAEHVPAAITLDEWNTWHPDLQLRGGPWEDSEAFNNGRKAKFLRQTSTGIEWAQWSWNPITGCLHDCPYCYARDIAERFEKAFPHGFAPCLWPGRLDAPSHMTVPSTAETDTRFRNVFTCSMADLFGRWVPAPWIEAILDSIKDNPQWNFLCLTKFPKRMSEFEIPDNAWMGTTVDLQARIPNAEAAFERLKGKPGIRWLSVEPMLEPLKFKRLDLFDWIVIGGASESTQTPEFRPPFEWIVDLVAQARVAGTRIYFKTNLLGNRLLEMPFDAPIIADPTEAPEVFHYLKKREAA